MNLLPSTSRVQYNETLRDGVTTEVPFFVGHRVSREPKSDSEVDFGVKKES